jgi:hypothetical protein
MKGLNKLEGLSIPWFAIVSIVLLIGGVITVVILTGSQQPDSSTQAGSIEYKIATEELNSGKDIVIGIDNITLYVPGSAITLPGSISLYPLKPILTYDADELPWYRPYVVNIEYSLKDKVKDPYSQFSFSTPVDVCFKLSSRQWEDYTKHSDEYQVQYLVAEEVPPRWKALPLVSHSERSELCGQTEDFSLFALAIKQPEPGIPITGVNSTPTPGSTTLATDLNPTPTPKPKSLITIISNFLHLGSDGSSGGGTGGVYEP